MFLSKLQHKKCKDTFVSPQFLLEKNISYNTSNIVLEMDNEVKTQEIKIYENQYYISLDTTILNTKANKC